MKIIRLSTLFRLLFSNSSRSNFDPASEINTREICSTALLALKEGIEN